MAVSTPSNVGSAEMPPLPPGIRKGTPLCLEDAQRIVEQYVIQYNTVRLHSAIGYITPQDKLEGREKEIFAERDRKLQEARERRKIKRQAVASLDSVSVV